MLVFRTFSALFKLFVVTRGDAFRCASRLPLAFIFRAFGAATATCCPKPTITFGPSTLMTRQSESSYANIFIFCGAVATLTAGDR